MSSSRLRPVAFALALSLLAPRAWASPPSIDTAGDETQAPRPAAALHSPGSDCPITGTFDPDGADRRREVGRATYLFAASHPRAGMVSPVPDPALGDVDLHIRRVNFVDDEIFGAMDKAGIRPAPLSADTEFLRRVTLDLTGQVPDAATVAAFLLDPLPEKRQRAVERLLASSEFVDRWAFFYDELFRNTAVAETGQLYPLGRNALHAYFVDAVRTGKPWNQMARELITASGNNQTVGAANFMARNFQNNGPIQDTFDNMAASTATVFLGTGALFCASCHDGAGHMDQINLWGATIKRQDFWGMAAFYSRLQRFNPQTPAFAYQVAESPTGDYRLNTTTGNKTTRQACTASVTTNCWTTTPAGLAAVTPRFLLGGGAPQAAEGYRDALARLVTSHPQFGRAAVNRVFAELFGLGIVEPTDGFDLARQDPSSPPVLPWTIQPTHPALLDRLAADYAAGGQDLRQLLRTLVGSSAYQLSSFYPGEWKEDYTPYFARHYVRRLRAEEIYDAITRATGVPINLPVNGYTSPVVWAGQLPDTTEPQNGAVRNFLNVFLRGNRDTNERSAEGAIPEALSLLNDRTVVTSRVSNATSGSLVRRLLAAGTAPPDIVRALFVATLSRLPNPSEQAAALALFNLPAGQTAQTKTTVSEDLQFSLLNKLDFLFNY